MLVRPLKLFLNAACCAKTCGNGLSHALKFQPFLYVVFGYHSDAVADCHWYLAAGCFYIHLRGSSLLFFLVLKVRSVTIYILVNTFTKYKIYKLFKLTCLNLRRSVMCDLGGKLLPLDYLYPLKMVSGFKYWSRVFRSISFWVVGTL